jgi:hypothetical protein
MLAGTPLSQFLLRLSNLRNLLSGSQLLRRLLSGRGLLGDGGKDSCVRGEELHSFYLSPPFSLLSPPFQLFPCKLTLLGMRRIPLVLILCLALVAPAGPSSPSPSSGSAPCDEAFHPVHQRQRSYGELAAVDFASSRQGWAVGHHDPFDGGITPLVVRFDAHSFEAVQDLPRLRGSVFLNGVSTPRRAEVFVAGSQVKGHNRWEAVVFRWDGRTWERMPTPPTRRDALLNGIEALSPRNVWAVGRMEAANGDERTLVLHYDGRRWARVPAPTPFLAAPYPTGHYANLTGVSARSPDDMWAIGNYANDDISRPFVLHWDGRTWTRVQLPAWITQPGPPRIPGAQSEHEFSGVDALAPDDVWVVGRRLGPTKGSTAVLVHHDGRTWRKVQSADYQGIEVLHGVEAVAAKEVWAVGVRWVVERGYGFPLALRWDGSTWARIGTGGSNEDVYGVASDGDDGVWAVGDGWGIERACETNED